MKKSITPCVHAILRADKADYLNAARNGLCGPRERVRKPLRLPPEVWEKIQDLAESLKAVFPDRYITVNSTLEFLIEEGFNAIQGNGIPSSDPVPHDTELEEVASGYQLFDE